MKAARVLFRANEERLDSVADSDSNWQVADLQKHGALTDSMCDLSGQLSQEARAV